MTERCPHGVLLPHECRECEASVSQAEANLFVENTRLQLYLNDAKRLLRLSRNGLTQGLAVPQLPESWKIQATAFASEINDFLERLDEH